jgi:MTH538 TIR-like domain (DUF1863)
MRNVFYSFHYLGDAWRASQVRNMGVLTGNSPCSDNDWESVKSGGDEAIKRWIANQMSGRTCAVILVGENTAGRKWIKHEVKEAWDAGKGVVAVRIHNLQDANNTQSSIGGDVFAGFTISGTSMSSIAKTYNPPYSASSNVYSHIHDNLEAWVEEAITIRKKY